MKRNLKILCIASLLFIMVFSLAGCGKEENTQQPQQNTENTETSENTENNFSRGEWIENQYVNDFAKIKFNLPQDWVKATDEQIAELMNAGTELLNDEQQQLAELSEGNTVYGMAANNPSTGANIMVTIEKPVLTVTPEYYLTSVKQQLERVETISYEVSEPTTAQIAGQEYETLTATVADYEIEQYYYVKAEGDYIIGIIITTTAEGQLEEIINCFE